MVTYGDLMDTGRDQELDAFWLEVLHRAKMLLSDMNVGGFHQWKEAIGDNNVNRLLKLMELIISPDSNQLEINFLTEFIIKNFDGEEFFRCFKISGKKIIKESMKGDIYCMPVLYVIIQYLANDSDTVCPSYFEHNKKTNPTQSFRFNPDQEDIKSR